MTNMSRPERNTLRPVNTERAAPTIQCDAIATTNETTTAVIPDHMRNGNTGMNALKTDPKTPHKLITQLVGLCEEQIGIQVKDDGFRADL